MASILITLNEVRGDDTAFRTDNHDDGDYLFIARGLERLGHRVLFADWRNYDDGGFFRVWDNRDRCFRRLDNLSELDLFIAYRIKDMIPRRVRFFEMIGRLEWSGVRVVNDPRTIRANISKDYYFPLREAGVAMPETYRFEELALALRRHDRVVVKPRVGESGNDQFLVGDPAEAAVLDVDPRDYLVQEFVPEIVQGEHSLIFIGNELQYGTMKRPRGGEYRCNFFRGGRYSPHRPTDAEIALATHALRTYESWGHPIHVSRVDMVVDERGPLLIELECVNPCVYGVLMGETDRIERVLPAYLDGLIREGANTRRSSQGHHGGLRAVG